MSLSKTGSEDTNPPFLKRLLNFMFSQHTFHEKEFTIIQLLVDNFLKAEIISFASTCDGQFISTIFSVSNNRMVNFGLF